MTKDEEKAINMMFGGRGKFDRSVYHELHKDIVCRSFDFVIKNKSESPYISTYRDHAMKLVDVHRNILNEYNYDYEEVQNFNKKCISFVFKKGGRIDHHWWYNEIEKDYDYLKVKKESYNVQINPKDMIEE